MLTRSAAGAFAIVAGLAPSERWRRIIETITDPAKLVVRSWTGGGGDYSPHSTGTRVLYLLNSLVGASVLSLVLSYLLQVYSSLRDRNTLALTVDLMTDGAATDLERGRIRGRKFICARLST